MQTGPRADVGAIVLDNRGVGRSDRVSRLFSMRTMADDVASVLDHAGCERATVFLYDTATDELVSQLATGVEEIRFSADRGIAGEVVRTGAGQAAQVKSMTGELWTSFNSQVMEYLQSVTLQDLVEQALRQGTVVEEKAPAARTKLPLAPKPRPLMARVNVPNSVFALGSMPILQRR